MDAAAIIARQMKVGEAQVMLALPYFAKAGEKDSFLEKYRDNPLFKCVESNDNFRGGHMLITAYGERGQEVIRHLREMLHMPFEPVKQRTKRRKSKSARSYVSSN